MKFLDIRFKRNRFLVKTVVPILSLFLLYIGFYLPARKKFLNLRKEWKRYAEILKEAGIAGYLSASDEIKHDSLAKRLHGLEKLFPSRDTDAIDSLTHLTYDLNIELVSLTPIKKEVALEVNKKEISAGERKVEKTRLKLSLRTNFRNLVKYLEELRKLPCLVTFEKALISKNQLLAVESDSLNIELEIAVYTLRQFLI